MRARASSIRRRVYVPLDPMHAPNPEQPVAPSATDLPRSRGEGVFLYAFDLAYEMERRRVSTLLGQPVAELMIDTSKRAPWQLFFYRPQMVRLPPMERLGPAGPVRVERT